MTKFLVILNNLINKCNYLESNLNNWVVLIKMNRLKEFKRYMKTLLTITFSLKSK